MTFAPIAIALVILLAASPETARPPRAGGGPACLVCGGPTGDTGLSLRHRGRQVVLHEGDCAAAWEQAPERHFAALQPRAALFDEPARQPRRLSSGWLWLGVAALAGIVCGSACAYVAIGKGRSPHRWFFAGLLGNLAALALLASRRAAGRGQLPQGVPAGLRKVPVTHAPARCPGCGAGLHPSASTCPRCGTGRRPGVVPETARTRERSP